jgi:hypothetical protein
MRKYGDGHDQYSLGGCCFAGAATDHCRHGIRAAAAWQTEPALNRAHFLPIRSIILPHAGAKWRRSRALQARSLWREVLSETIFRLWMIRWRRAAGHLRRTASRSATSAFGGGRRAPWPAPGARTSARFRAWFWGAHAGLRGNEVHLHTEMASYSIR